MKEICESNAKELNGLRREQEAIKTENEELKQQLEKLKDGLVQEKNKVFTEGNRSHLVMGDSLLRSIDEDKLQNTNVKCLQGAEISDVLHSMTDIDDIYMDITICVGTHDCEKDDFVPNDSLTLTDN